MSIQTMEEERVYTVTIKRRTQFVASEWAKERYKGDSDNLCGGICVDDYTKESEVTSDFAFRKVDPPSSTVMPGSRVSSRNIRKVPGVNKKCKVHLCREGRVVDAPVWRRGAPDAGGGR